LLVENLQIYRRTTALGHLGFELSGGSVEERDRRSWRGA
jgi:hypothetical protein